jgi:SAM-dependent methyltransferase
MTTLYARERDLYAGIWDDLPQYADVAPGERYVSVLRDHCPPPATVLDAGTGSGKGALALARAGYAVVLCDLTAAGLVEEARALPFAEACLWRPLAAQGLAPVDAVYCTDVLEHLPPQLVLLAVDRMLSLARRGVLISVALHADGFGVWVGRPLHLTVESFLWWRDSLREVGQVTDARDLIASGLYWVTR